MALLRPVNKLIKCSLRSASLKYSVRVLSTEISNESPPETKVGGYAQAFEKFENIKKDGQAEEPSQSFASLLRHSKFIDLGDPEGKVVTGKVFHVVDDDLYIDFGWKFHCVCPRPRKNASEYVKGARVRLLIKQFELSSKFLGYEKDITLLEADCILLGLIQDRSKTSQ